MRRKAKKEKWSCLLLSNGSDVVCISDGPEDVKRRVSDAKKMLQLWKSSYLETRARIEASGRDSRWEFDRKKLFEKTDHMADVCEDLFHIAQVHGGKPEFLKIESPIHWFLLDLSGFYCILGFSFFCLKKAQLKS